MGRAVYHLPGICVLSASIQVPRSALILDLLGDGGHLQYPFEILRKSVASYIRG